MAVSAAKILHVVVNFSLTDRGIREFEAVAPGVNEFVRVGPSLNSQFRLPDCVRTLTPRQFRGEVRRAEVAGVVFHSLPPHHRRLLRDIPPGKVVVWIGWGFDYYDDLLWTRYPDGLVLPGTRALVRQSSWRNPAEMARDCIQRIKSACTGNDVGLLRRVDVFCPVLDQEYELVRSANPWFGADYLTWNYLTLEDDMPFDLPDGEKRQGVDLLAGNSASPTNNHVELFEAIARHVDLAGRRVYVPLGYGDPRYRDRVVAAGERLLGSHFVPLTEYLPYPEYVGLVSSCGYVLMYHLRQQALGNLFLAALSGARIFLERRNPLWEWLEQRGVEIGDVTAPDTRPATPQQRSASRVAIITHWQRATQRQRTARLVGRILGAEPQS
ncbi:MAG: TDP-N-acetylfucosamine:lipid II N-acetylfucosaminyltransferase [Planctomycetaceae bacterium]|jgi:dTDP-N-acetylfucosamine:lipid II N-acetylfucosaminyltransferase